MNVYTIKSLSNTQAEQFSTLADIARHLDVSYPAVWQAYKRGYRVKGYSIERIEAPVVMARKLTQRQLQHNRSHSTIANKGMKLQQWTKDQTKLIGEYLSMADAEHETMIAQANISQCVRGITKSAGGYIWRVIPQSDPNDQE